MIAFTLAVAMSYAVGQTFGPVPLPDPFTQKWTHATGAATTLGPLAVDVDADGIFEIFATGHDVTTCLDGATGDLIWSFPHVSVGTHSAFEIADLDRDGLPELVMSAGIRTIALHADSGSEFWIVNVESSNKHLVIADVDGTGYPYVYICSADPYHGLEGTGRLRKLDGRTGEVLAEVFAWFPCHGGLSLADVDHDGRFELFMTDRASNYPDDGYGKGIQCYDAHTLDLLWYDDRVTCSSHCAALVDVNGDTVLDAVVVQQVPPDPPDDGGIYVIDGATGEPMPGKCADHLGLHGHAQFSVHDIDDDGHLELITAHGSPAVSWDLVTWTQDASFGWFGEPPTMGNVMGDERLEIIGGGDTVRIYGHPLYTLLWTINAPARNSQLVQDIDADGLNELVSVDSAGTIRAYDTLATAPRILPRTSTLYYSERNTGAAVYIPRPNLDCNGNGLEDEYEVFACGDFDGNGSVDCDDLVEFDGCMGGPGARPSLKEPDCEAMCLQVFDWDENGSVDLLDYAAFQVAVSP